MPRRRKLGLVVVLLVRLLPWTSAQHLGSPLRYVSDECEALKQSLDVMAINGDQLANGIVGGHVVESDCTKLRTLNVLDHRDDDNQNLLCGNSCFNATAATYAAMLNNDCFHGDDEYEVANQRLYAASFQFACQRYAPYKYCVTLLGDTVASAGGSYDLCTDIVKPLECCYESYRRYMLFGTNTSVTEMSYISKKCSDVVTDACPCHLNSYAANVTHIYVCSAGGRATASMLLVLTLLSLLQLA